MRKYLIPVLIIIASVTLAYFLTQGSTCGDGKCSSGEQCCNDCGCGLGDACDFETQLCTVMECGDNVCDNNEECCEDCGCGPGEYCNPDTQECLKQRELICGNGYCDAGEVGVCCVDCGCTSGYVCNLNTKNCVKRGTAAICGDGVCDFGESVRDCCEDCNYCEEGMLCNTRTHQCEVMATDISPEEAIQEFKAFLLGQEFTVDRLNEYDWRATPDVFEGAPVMMVCNQHIVPVDNVQDIVCARVTVDGEVVGFVRFW